MLERSIKVAAPDRLTIKRCHRHSPARHIRLLSCDICGNRISIEEPDIDSGARPLHRIDSSALSVEPSAESRSVGGRDAAAGAGIAGVTVFLKGLGAGEGVDVVDVAAGRGVQGNGVGGGNVDALDDVYFPGGGPVGTEHPEGRPGAAPDRHVGDVCNEDSLCCCLLALLLVSLGLRAGAY